MAQNSNARENRVVTAPVSTVKTNTATTTTKKKTVPAKAVAATPVVDPYAQYAAQQATARAQADAAQAALDTQRNTTNRQVFRQLMGSYFNLANDSVWIDALFDNAKKYYDQDITGDSAVELLLREENAPQQFKDRFSSYLKVNAENASKGLAPAFKNLAQYVATENAYADKLTSYTGFADLNTKDNIKKFIENRVAVDEVGRRIDNAYYAVRTADSALKEQIRQQFPSITDDDLAKSLVTGTTDSVQQKIKFGAAAIAAEAQTAGLQAMSDITDLSKQGVTREQARTAFQKIGQEQTGIQKAARKFGQSITQQELEQEAFGVKPSKTASALRSQARAQYAGQSGITTGSLGKKKSSSQL